MTHETFYDKGRSYIANHLDCDGYRRGFTPPASIWDVEDALTDIFDEERETQYGLREDAFIKRLEQKENSCLRGDEYIAACSRFASTEGREFTRNFPKHTYEELQEFIRGVREGQKQCTVYFETRREYEKASEAYDDLMCA